MAIVETNWSQFLEPNSELPTDVVFKVEERSEEDVGEVWTEKVVAHKLLLAGVSPVFRRQFFGAFKEEMGEVVIKDTTIEAFNTMIKFIYMEPGVEFSFKDVVNPQSLCELVNLSEKYQIQKLKAKANSALDDISVTEENFINTATTAKHYAAFEDVAKTLTSKCHLFLKQSLRSAEDVYSFIDKIRKEFPEFDMEVLFDLLQTRNGISKKIFLFYGVELSFKVQDI